MAIEIMLVTMCSSSAVERGFSAVRRQLRDQRVLMKHKLLDESLRIKINMLALRELIQNCDNLVVAKAVEVYHKKKKWRWKVKEPVSKKSRTSELEELDPMSRDPEDSSDSDNEYSDEDHEWLYDSDHSYSYSSSDDDSVI